VRALVTGGAGFIGSYLCEHLLLLGHEVVVLDDLSTGRLGNIDHLKHRSDFDFRLGSILDEGAVADAVSGVDAVFHLAAAVGVELVVRRPLEGLEINVRGSENVLAAAHAAGAKVLVTSSSEIYGKNYSDRLSEGDDRVLGSPLKSRWSYSEGKAIEEILAYTYWRERGMATVIARLFNTVGPRQSDRYGMVLSRFVRQAVRGEPITVFGDGSQTRCFVAVSDVVPALFALLETPAAYGEAVNVGSTEEVSIAELAERVVRVAGSKSKIRFIPYDEAYEEGFEDMARRVPDITKAEALVGFRPTKTLDEIIEWLVRSERERQGTAQP